MRKFIWHLTGIDRSGCAFGIICNPSSERVDIESTNDSSGVYDIGWIKAGEWTEYTVNVSTTGTYSLDLRLRNSQNGGFVHVEVDGVNVTGPVAVPNAGSWSSWGTVTVSGISLASGQHVVRLAFDTESPVGWVGDFNYMIFRLN